MSTADQTPSSVLHGEALFTAKSPELQPPIDHFREAAQDRDAIRVECAGILAGSWFSGTTRRGEELIAAGLLMLAGHVDLDELDKWLRTGWERRRGQQCRTGRPANRTRPFGLSPMEQIESGGLLTGRNKAATFSAAFSCNPATTWL
jgi:hypothetical protein